HLREEVDWDIDADGFRFVKALNRGEKGYSGPAVDEAVFEMLIDRFEKAVRADLLPDLPSLEQRLASLVPESSLIGLAYDWWVGRRKALAMPLLRELRPPPDPEDPDTTGVAFRPREKEGTRRMRSNNRKTYNLMAQLHGELVRLQTLAERIKQRELTKLELHRANGDYTEAAHRTLVNRLSRQRSGGVWKDDLEEREMLPASATLQPVRTHLKQERSHKKRHHLSGTPPRREGYGSESHPPNLPSPCMQRHQRIPPTTRHATRELSVFPTLQTAHHGPHPVGRPRGRHAANAEEEARRRGHAERVSAIDALDSEEEAYSQMVLRVDTAKRDDLVRFLPPHLREVASRPQPEPQPESSASEAAPSAANAPSAALSSRSDPHTSNANAPSSSANVPSFCTFSKAEEGGPRSFKSDDGEEASVEEVRHPSSSMYVRSFLPKSMGNEMSQLPTLLAHVLAHGRVRVPPLREEQLDPDTAWRQNRPLQIKRSPLLFNFKELQKPDLASGAANEGGAASSAASRGNASEPGPAEDSTGVADKRPLNEPNTAQAALKSSFPSQAEQARKTISNGRKRKSLDEADNSGERTI
ncbi:MAG: hypothetical protein SGPRY_009079, partial [Prymnesium sp.]